jgi:hypothetical protein
MTENYHITGREKSLSYRHRRTYTQKVWNYFTKNTNINLKLTKNSTLLWSNRMLNDSDFRLIYEVNHLLPIVDYYSDKKKIFIGKRL